MKPTNKQLADFYGLHPNTIGNYKKLPDYRRIYEALVMFYNESMRIENAN
jgi:hypothetical protein